jgi:uncharacterized protein
MSQLPTPDPTISPDNQPFWEGAAQGRLVVPRCNGCSEVIWYPRHFCPFCGTADVTWFEASGRGTVYSFTVVERGQGRWAPHSPYVLAYVELEEGPRVMTNIIDGDPDAVAIGSTVTATFDSSEDGNAILRFRLTP